MKFKIITSITIITFALTSFPQGIAMPRLRSAQVVRRSLH